MSDRDKYGNYVNDEGVVIKVNTDKYGNDHVSFYGGNVDEQHDAAHIDVNYNKNSWSTTTHGPDKSDTSHSSGSCYLTTACLMHMNENFKDDCEELSILRWFRDDFVVKEDIFHYYNIAPIIVESINEEEENDKIYEYIYENVVQYCVNSIKKGEYTSAYNRYKNTVHILEEKFARPKLESRLIKTLKLI